MANSANTLNPNQQQPQAQKSQYAGQSNAKNDISNKVGNNVVKDEPTAGKKSTGMQAEAEDNDVE